MQYSKGPIDVSGETILRTRGNLPHLEGAGGIYFVTFRLADSLPAIVMESYRQIPPDSRGEPVGSYLDTCKGACWLRNHSIAQLVVDALKYFDGERYRLHAWCVMPNHVPVVFSQHGASSRQGIAHVVHSWKSFTSSSANRILGRSGPFWQREYYDHLIRDEREFLHFIEYTLQNPVKADLCADWREWPWTGVGDMDVL